MRGKVYLLIMIAIVMSAVGCGIKSSGSGAASGSSVAADDAVGQSDMVLALEQTDFKTGEESTLGMHIYCSSLVGETVDIVDETGKTLVNIVNDGSGNLYGEVKIYETEKRFGELKAVSGEIESSAAGFYVMPEVTEAMTEHLADVGENLATYVENAGFKDYTSQNTLEDIVAYLKADTLVADAVINNDVVLFETVDGFMGAYGPETPDDGTFGYTSTTEAYDAWNVGEGTSEMVIPSGRTISNRMIKFLSPLEHDPTCTDYLTAYRNPLEDLAANLDLNVKLYSGVEGRTQLTSGAYTDCGILLLMTHGWIVNRSDNSPMLVISASDENATTESLRDFLKDVTPDSRVKFYGQLSKPESNKMLYYFSYNTEESRFECELNFTSSLLMDSIKNRMFDNTIVYMIVCQGLRDRQLVHSFIDHGASAVIGCTKKVNSWAAQYDLRRFCQTLQSQDGNGVYRTLQNYIDGAYTDEVQADMDQIFRFVAEEAERTNTMEKSTLEKEIQNNRAKFEKAMSEQPMEHTFIVVKQRALAGSESLSGKVVDPEKKAVEGATVRAYQWMNHSFTQLASAVTDKDGNYEFTNLPYGVYAVYAEKDDVSGRIGTLFDSENIQAADIILNPLILTGKVTDSETGETLEGVTINIYNEGDSEQITTAVTDASGKWEVMIARKNYSLQFTKDGYAEKTEGMVYQVTDADKTQDYGQTLLEPEKDVPIIWSSNIAEYNGVNYCLKSRMTAESLEWGDLEVLPFETAQYDYICGLAFYHGRAYYACKESGTSGYRSAIYTCKPDGSDMILLAQSDGNACTSFYIVDCKLFFDEYFKYVDLKTYEVKNPEYIEVPDGFDMHYVGTTAYYTTGEGMFRVTSDPYSETQILTYPGYSQPTLQAATKEYLYYTYYVGSKGYLQRYELSTETSRVIDSHPLAGGGDPYFNW